MFVFWGMVYFVGLGGGREWSVMSVDFCLFWLFVLGFVLLFFLFVFCFFVVIVVVLFLMIRIFYVLYDF